jgi:hypothetical protein
MNHPQRNPAAIGQARHLLQILLRREWRHFQPRFAASLIAPELRSSLDRNFSAPASMSRIVSRT